MPLHGVLQTKKHPFEGKMKVEFILRAMVDSATGSQLTSVCFEVESMEAAEGLYNSLLESGAIREGVAPNSDN